MKLTPRHTLPLLASLALAGALATGCTPGGTSTPPPLEESASFDCATHGNRICGPLTEAAETAGWKVWDESAGYRSLKVDPSRPYRVDYVGVSARPSLAEGEYAVIGKDFQWHVFRAAYTD